MGCGCGKGKGARIVNQRKQATMTGKVINTGAFRTRPDAITQSESNLGSARVYSRSTSKTDGNEYDSSLGCWQCYIKHLSKAAVEAGEFFEEEGREAEFSLCIGDLACAEDHARALGLAAERNTIRRFRSQMWLGDGFVASEIAKFASNAVKSYFKSKSSETRADGPVKIDDNVVASGSRPMEPHPVRTKKPDAEDSAKTGPSPVVSPEENQNDSDFDEMMNRMSDSYDGPPIDTKGDSIPAGDNGN